MKSLSKLILTAIIICGTATTALAGMEPFYKGEWGMTPDEVKALYDVPSIMVEKSEDGNYYFKEYAIPYYVSGNKPNNFLLYEFTAADKTGYAFYSFTNSEIPENLTLQYVYCGFIVDESFWRNREVIIKEIATLITANTDDFDYFSTPWVEDRTIQ